MVGISSNDVGRLPAGQTRSRWSAEARRHGSRLTAYLYDETQDVARAYSAACTPDTFVFDGERRRACPRPARRLPPPERPTGDGR